jgi:NTE family protein
MLDAAYTHPDVLVLAAGGVLGEAWMSGVLAGTEQGSGADFRTTETMIGTSAGSIVAASLAAGRRPRRPSEGAPRSSQADGSSQTGNGSIEDSGAAGAAAALGSLAARSAQVLTAPFAPLALAAGAPAGARLRATLLARVPSGGRSLGELRREVASHGARFDGRLRVVCVDRGSGRRVVFGAPGAPEAEAADAVAASCAIPWVFQPVKIGGREYVDGGVWSLTNLDVAPVGRDTHVLCLNPTAGLAMATGSPLGVLRAAARGAEAVEALALRRRGAQVKTIAPDTGAAAAMGTNLMAVGPAQRVLAEGYRQGLELAGG